MSEKKKELYLHLGLPKAASSYLQQTVFPRLQGIRYYPKPYFKRFPEILEKGAHTRYLFSTEMFGRLEERAQRIAEQFPDAGVVLVFRRQDRWIRSRYKYYLWKSGNTEFREFFDIHNDAGYWKRSSLFFSPSIDELAARFRHPPLVLFQEDLEEDAAGWLQRLQAFTGTHLPPGKFRKAPLKVSFSDRQLILLRAFNQRFPYRKPQHGPKFFRQLHMHVRQGMNYLVALTARFFPSSYFRDKELIPAKDLEAIRSFYEKDWKDCKKWAERKKETLS